MDHHTKPGSPGDILEHHGVKGMRWGVTKKEETTERDATTGLIQPSGAIAKRNETQKSEVAKAVTDNKDFRPGTPEFQQVIERVTRTDRPQVLSAPRTADKTGASRKKDGKVEAVPQAEKHGLSRNQKMLITFGAVTAAAAGYYAYQHYAGGKLPDGISREVLKEQQQVSKLGSMKIPAHWDTSGLRNGPISQQPLGKLGGGHINTELLDPKNLVVNTSRGYADILPKDGLRSAFAAEQHASVTRVLEQMRDKYPAIRNMNVEVVPYSTVPGMDKREGSHMCVMAMRAGEARVMYNDFMEAPSKAAIRNSRNFLPGLGKKDYVAMHEMGHLISAAHGELPPAFNLATGGGKGQSMLDSLAERGTWHKAEPLLHQQMFLKHGFTFKELSKISGYAATQPAEAMAELFGHYTHPEMRNRLTPDQLTRAKSMFDEMGGIAESGGVKSVAKAAAGSGSGQYGSSAGRLSKVASRLRKG